MMTSTNQRSAIGNRVILHRLALLVILAVTSLSLGNFAVSAADVANLKPSPPAVPDSTGALFSLLRVMGALAVVLAIFAGGVWLYRNWQRVLVRNGRVPKLNIHETRSLGNRHALFVVGYEDQRLLIGSSPTGITLLTQLPSSEDTVEVMQEQHDKAPARLGFKQNFATALRQVLVRKPS